MTHPRVLQFNEQPLYRGPFSITRTEEQPFTFPSGQKVTAVVHRSIDTDQNPELLIEMAEGKLNPVSSSRTGERMTAPCPVVVHDPRHRLLFLVLPQHNQAQEIRWRMEFLAALGEEENLPDYVLNFIVETMPFGPDELARYRESLGGALDRDPASQGFTGRGIETSPGDGTAQAGRFDDEKTPTERAWSPYYDRDEEILELSSDELELMEEPEPEPAPQAGDGAATEAGARGTSHPTVARASESASVRDTLREMKAFSLPRPLPFDLADVPLGRGRPMIDDNERVSIHFAVDHARARAFLQREPEILLQLHRLPTYPVISILLVAKDESDALLDELVSVFDVKNPDDGRVLDRLREDFRLDVHLYDESGNRVQYLSYQRPLEWNVGHVLDEAQQWLVELGDERQDFVKSSQFFTSEGYERIGAQKPGFTQTSFAEISTATAARLAVSIVGYWSEQQNFAYLIENRSFPLEYYRQIELRVVEGALRFGVFLPYDLRKRALAFGLAESHATLVESLVRRFAEVVDSKRSRDLDSVAQSENWEQLSAASTDLGLTLDEHSRELAEQARRRSRQLRSTPGVNLLDIQETDEYQRVSSITQAGDADLRDLMLKGGMAPLVTRELLSRGGETNVLCVIESARYFDEEALDAVARILAAGAEQFEPALLMGLGREQPRTVHLCALALAMARRVEALPTLFVRMHDLQLNAQVPLRDIAAYYGKAAIPSLFEAIQERGPTDPLVEVLALISVEHGSDIIAALRENPGASLLDAAQKMTLVRRRLKERVIRSFADDDEHGPPDGEESESGEGES